MLTSNTTHTYVQTKHGVYLVHLNWLRPSVWDRIRRAAL